MCARFAFIVLAFSLLFGGCFHPHQAAYAALLPWDWKNPQSRPSPPKRIKVSSTKPPQLVSQRPRRTRASSPKPTQAVRNQARSVPPLPPRKPEEDHSPTSASREGSGTVEQENEAKFKA